MRLVLTPKSKPCFSNGAHAFLKRDPGANEEMSHPVFLPLLTIFSDPC